MEPEVNTRYRLAVVGDAGTGKSTLLQQHNPNHFTQAQKNVYPSAQVVMLVFDVTDIVSFNSRQQWLEEIRAKVDYLTPIMLVANKIEDRDLRVVTHEAALTFAEENDLLYAETSAQTHTGVAQAFDQLKRKADQIHTHMHAQGSHSPQASTSLSFSQSYTNTAQAFEDARVTTVQTFLQELEATNSAHEALNLFEQLKQSIDAALQTPTQTRTPDQVALAALYHRDGGSIKGGQIWPSPTHPGQHDPVTETFNYIVRVTRLKMIEQLAKARSEDDQTPNNPSKLSDGTRQTFTYRIQSFFDIQTKTAQSFKHIKVYQSEEQNLMRDLRKLPYDEAKDRRKVSDFRDKVVKTLDKKIKELNKLTNRETVKHKLVQQLKH